MGKRPHRLAQQVESHFCVFVCQQFRNLPGLASNPSGQNIGPPGVGKTMLAQAIGYEAIKQGFVVCYRSIFDLVRDFLADDALQQRDRVLNQYIKPDLTIIDDMGLRALPKHSAEYLLEVIMRRYETRSTIMTSNRPLEDWGKLLQDVPTAGAVLDRFLHHATVVTITGESYRLKDAALAKSKPKES
jgi:DNA replication protein DnaC